MYVSRQMKIEIVVTLPKNNQMQSTIPLAERLRPTTLDDYIGQKHIIGENAVLRRAIESGRVPSMIFWGPPGVGKTTLACSSN